MKAQNERGFVKSLYRRGNGGEDFCSPLRPSEKLYERSLRALLSVALPTMRRKPIDAMTFSTAARTRRTIETFAGKTGLFRRISIRRWFQRGQRSTEKLI